MKISIKSVTERKDLKTGQVSREDQEATAEVKHHDHGVLLVLAAPNASISDASMTTTDGNVEVRQGYSLGSCKEMGFENKEVSVNHLKTSHEGSLYKVVIL